MLWRQNNPEVTYFPTRISGGRGVFLGETSRRRQRGLKIDNIRMDLQEVGCGYVDWIGLAQYRDRWRTLVSAIMNLRVP
jgi:hypothetical protein